MLTMSLQNSAQFSIGTISKSYMLSTNSICRLSRKDHPFGSGTDHNRQYTNLYILLFFQLRIYPP